MEEYSTISELKEIEKNYGLTPADCLILEIQKPKMPFDIKRLNDQKNKNSPRRRGILITKHKNDIMYKEQNVRKKL